jgi:hypothetical protein
MTKNKSRLQKLFLFMLITYNGKAILRIEISLNASPPLGSIAFARSLRWTIKTNKSRISKDWVSRGFGVIIGDMEEIWQSQGNRIKWLDRIKYISLNEEFSEIGLSAAFSQCNEDLSYISTAWEWNKKQKSPTVEMSHHYKTHYAIRAKAIQLGFRVRIKYL